MNFENSKITDERIEAIKKVVTGIIECANKLATDLIPVLRIIEDSFAQFAIEQKIMAQRNESLRKIPKHLIIEEGGVVGDRKRYNEPS